MTNLDPNEYDNVINPFTLSEKQQRKIIDLVRDKRLSNPPGDYFKVKLESETIDIPKLEYVSQKTTEGRITRLPTVDYIRKLLDKEV